MLDLTDSNLSWKYFFSGNLNKIIVFISKLNVPNSIQQSRIDKVLIIKIFFSPVQESSRQEEDYNFETLLEYISISKSYQNSTLINTTKFFMEEICVKSDLVKRDISLIRSLKQLFTNQLFHYFQNFELVECYISLHAR